MKRNLLKAAVAGLALAAAGIAPLARAQDKGLIAISMPTKSSARWIADGANNAYVTWYSPEIPVRFGVRIVAPVQVFGMGKRPYWDVCWDNNPGRDPQWARSGSDPSDPRTFFADGHVGGLAAIGRAQSWHTALDLTVTISDYTGGKP